MKAHVDEEAVRITQQFRSGESMIYDFRSPEGRLTLRVSGRGGDEGPPTEWGIEASSTSSPDGVVVAEWAPTRAQALEAVGRSWRERRLACHLPLFDWESVARAMTAVRAL